MTGWISLFATLLLQSGISLRVRGSRLDIAELFQLSDRICRGPLTPIFCRIVLRVWIKKKYSFIVQLQQNINLLPFSSWYLFFFSLPTLCYYVAGKKTFSSKEIKHVQQPLLRYSTKNNLWEKIYRCHPCYVLEFGQSVVTNYKECNRIIRYNTIFIQYSKFVLSISQLPKNRYTYLFIYFGQGNFKQEGIKVILVFYFHNFSPPSFFSHENQYTTILIYTQTSI